MPQSTNALRTIFPPLVIGLLALLNAGRVWFFLDGIWDDNTWLFSIYATSSLDEFLNTGLRDQRRELLGTFSYYLLSLHKSTVWFYPLLHALNLSTQILCPILLYFLLRNLFKTRPGLSLFAAFAMIAFPLDHTLPYISSLNYRISMTLSLFSLLSTERALAANRLRPLHSSFALLSAALSQYIFLEASIAFEPARLLLIWMIHSQSPAPSPFLLRQSLLRWAPFVLLSLPLIYSKLRYKPYGMYTGTYPGDPLFFLDGRYVFNSFLQIIDYGRRDLSQATRLDNSWAIALGLGACCLFYLAINRITFRDETRDSALPSSLWSRLQAGVAREWPTARAALILGTLFFIPGAGISLYYHLPFVEEQHNTHASLLHFGTALLLGTSLYLLRSLFAPIKQAIPITICLATLLGFGVFVNNKHLDLYAHSWDEQSRFLKAFLARFPSLPEHATFFFDVKNKALLSDLRNPIDFEFPINLFFATSDTPQQFRRYLAMTPDEWRSYHPEVDRWTSPRATTVIRPARWHNGPSEEILRASDLIFIWYRDGELLVNREILQRHPDVEYRQWIDKNFPQLPPAGRYVFREKLHGL